MGAYDAMTAMIAQQAGAKALYISGYAAAASAFGLPDLGIVSQAEMVEHIRRICQASSLPVIADGDTGYGGILNVERTIREWESAGAAGLHLEDQGFPKRCGHVAGKQVIPITEMEQKIAAALNARTDPEFFVIARTDALAVNGIEDTLERCRRYAEAGADAIFVDAPESEAQLDQIHNALSASNKPLVYNSARTGKSPFLTEKRLAELGYPIVLYPLAALLAAHHAVNVAMGQILRDGSTNSAATAMSTFQQLNDMLGMTRYVEREAAHAA